MNAVTVLLQAGLKRSEVCVLLTGGVTYIFARMPEERAETPAFEF